MKAFAARHTFRFCLGIAALAAVGGSTTGCMLFQFEQGPTFQLVEENLIPESGGTQLALAPVLIPLGTIAALSDVLIVNPIIAGRESVETVGDVLWEDLEWDEHYMEESAALPWRVIGTPIVFAGRWVWGILFTVPGDDRAYFDAEPGRVEARESARAALAEARALLEAGDAEGALVTVESQRGYFESAYAPEDQELQAQLNLVGFKAGVASGRADAIWRYGAGTMYLNVGGEYRPILHEVLNAEEPIIRSIGYRLLIMRPDSLGIDYSEAVRRGLSDPDADVRGTILQQIQPGMPTRFDDSLIGRNPELRELLERIAREDSSEFNRRQAQLLLDLHGK